MVVSPGHGNYKNTLGFDDKIIFVLITGIKSAQKNQPGLSRKHLTTYNKTGNEEEYISIRFSLL